MPTFEYQAKEGPTKIVKGTIEAENESAAIHALSAQGIVLVSVKQVERAVPAGHALRFGRSTITVRDVYIITYQLVDLIASGLTVDRALDTIITQVEKPAVADVLTDVSQRVKEGMAFSQSLARHPRVFNIFFVNMVKAGEASGTLETVLTQLATVLEQEYDLRTRIRQALAYPTLIAICGIGTIIAILTFVIPRLESMYSDLGQSLPIITQVVIQSSNFLVHTWWIILIMIMLGIWYIRHQLTQPKRAARFFDTVILRLPVWGALLRREELARFARSFALLERSGVSLLEALLIARDILRSAAFQHDITELHRKVQQGSRLHEAMRTMKSFSTLVVNMVATGETSGRLDASLVRVANAYEKDVDAHIKMITTLIEPVLVLIIGLIVGIVVISMLLPIFQINIFVR